ncbi:MAG: helix-turn-helix domain-containing protein [Gammaproteobacteria bacterium]|nr:helix-turn-helix domain-containing protein [Gammaproteobacteria bacterium]
MTTQIIERAGQPEYAVVPWAEYQVLKDDAESFHELASAARLSSAIDAGEETYPDSLVERLLSGENPITVWREYRGLSCAALADTLGISSSILAQIENGKGELTPPQQKAMAKALNVDLDLLA